MKRENARENKKPGELLGFQGPRIDRARFTTARKASSQYFRLSGNRIRIIKRNDTDSLCIWRRARWWRVRQRRGRREDSAGADYSFAAHLQRDAVRFSVKMRLCSEVPTRAWLKACGWAIMSIVRSRTNQPSFLARRESVHHFTYIFGCQKKK